MAKVRVMYWNEIPAQVQADDESVKASIPLESRFQEGIDAIAMMDGSAGTDAYLDGWGWHDFGDVDGNAEEAATVVSMRFNERFPEDFVARIRDLSRSGARDPSPGAVNGWLDE